MWYRYKVQVQVQDVLELATLTCVEGRRHSFGAGGAFLTKNGKKGERKGRVLRAIVGASSLCQLKYCQNQIISIFTEEICPHV